MRSLYSQQQRTTCNHSVVETVRNNSFYTNGIYVLFNYLCNKNVYLWTNTVSILNIYVCCCWSFFCFAVCNNGDGASPLHVPRAFWPRTSLVTEPWFTSAYTIVVIHENHIIIIFPNAIIIRKNMTSHSQILVVLYISLITLILFYNSNSTRTNILTTVRNVMTATKTYVRLHWLFVSSVGLEFKSKTYLGAGADEDDGKRTSLGNGSSISIAKENEN